MMSRGRWGPSVCLMCASYEQQHVWPLVRVPKAEFDETEREYQQSRTERAPWDHSGC